MDVLEGLDPGIAHAVEVLRENGVETCQSCEGGEGHSYPEPTVEFYGDASDGWRALFVALRRQLPVRELRRIWHVIDGEPNGPLWAMAFYRKVHAPGGADAPQGALPAEAGGDPGAVIADGNGRIIPDHWFTPLELALLGANERREMARAWTGYRRCEATCPTGALGPLRCALLAGHDGPHRPRAVPTWSPTWPPLGGPNR